MLEVQKSFPDCRLFQQHVGKFFGYRLFESLANGYNIFDLKQICFKFLISIGLKGMSDLYGIIKINGVGRFIAIEVKTGKAVRTKEQKAFARMVQNLGGMYIEARSVEQVIDEITKTSFNKN